MLTFFGYGYYIQEIFIAQLYYIFLTNQRLIFFIVYPHNGYVLDELRYQFRRSIPAKSMRQAIVVAFFLFVLPIGISATQQVQTYRASASVVKQMPDDVKKIGDVNGDNLVNKQDLDIVVDSYESQSIKNPKADIDGDGKVTLTDIGIVTDNYAR